MPVEISLHASKQMEERGVSEEEVLITIRQGEAEPGNLGRKIFKKNFQFGKIWRGRFYKIKQVIPVIAVEPDKLVVVTVYVFYF